MGKSLAFNPAKEKSHSPILEEILRSFLSKHQNVLDRSKNTLRSYKTTLRIFLEYLDARVPLTSLKNLEKSLDGESLRLFLREISTDLNPRSHAHHASVLRTFVRWAHAEGYLGENLERHIESPKLPKRLLKVPNQDFLAELAEVLRQAPDRDEELLFQILYGSGLRIQEASDLCWKDIDLNRQVASILGKGRKRREIPLTPRALELLQDRIKHRSPNVRIWLRAQSSRSHRRWVDSWNRFQADLNAPKLHPHQLRHSLATHLLQRGAGLPQIQRLLGHSRLETTQNYTHLDLKDLQRIYARTRPRLKKG